MGTLGVQAKSFSLAKKMTGQRGGCGLFHMSSKGSGWRRAQLRVLACYISAGHAHPQTAFCARTLQPLPQRTLRCAKLLIATGSHGGALVAGPQSCGLGRHAMAKQRHSQKITFADRADLEDSAGRPRCPLSVDAYSCHRSTSFLTSFSRHWAACRALRALARQK